VSYSTILDLFQPGAAAVGYAIGIGLSHSSKQYRTIAEPLQVFQAWVTKKSHRATRCVETAL
jgi:hypothetical protein